MFGVAESPVNFGFNISMLKGEITILKNTMVENRATIVKVEESIALYSLMLSSTNTNVSSLRTEMAEIEKILELKRL